MIRQEAVKIAVDCAKNYQRELEKRSLLILYRNRSGGETEGLEVFFFDRNFQHLTGLEFSGGARYFYKKCLKNRLSPGEIRFKQDGTTELKLRVLETMVTRNLSCHMVGAFNGRGPRIQTDRLAGNVHACMGFVVDNTTGLYVPNVVMRADIRDWSRAWGPVLAVYRKGKDEGRYTECTYGSPAALTDCPPEYAYLLEQRDTTVP